MMDALQKRVVGLAQHLPGVEESVSWNTPCLKVGKKLLIRVRDDEDYMLPFSRLDRDLLVEMAPDIYYYTDHFRNYDYVLVRSKAIGDDELQQRIEAVWRQIAPKRLQQLVNKSGLTCETCSGCEHGMSFAAPSSGRVTPDARAIWQAPLSRTARRCRTG